MKRVILILLVCLLSASVNAVTDYLPDESVFYTDYLQANIYGQGGAGYVLNDVCRATVDIQYTNIGSVCVNDAFGTRYGYSGTITTECTEGMNILNYMKGNWFSTAMMAFPFIHTGVNNKLNESYIIKPDWGFNWGTSQTLTCDNPTNKTCTITFSDTLGAYANYICYDDSYVWDDNPINFWVDSRDVYGAPVGYSNHSQHGLFTGVYNVTNALLVPYDYSVGEYGYIQEGTVFDWNFSEAKYEAETSIDKTLIVNITSFPTSISLTGGQTGLWDCETNENGGFYLPIDRKPTPLEYQNLKSNCCNLINSQNPATNCNHYPSVSNDGVTDEGNFRIALDVACENSEYTPQFVYWYSSEAYKDHFLIADVDLMVVNEPIEKLLLWDGIGQNYEVCFNFIDALKEHPDNSIDADYGYFSYSYDINVFPNAYSKITLNKSSLALVTGESIYYKAYFTKTGYNNSQPVVGQYIYNPTCKDIKFNRPIGAGENNLNGTIYVRQMGQTGVLTGATLNIHCPASEISFNSVSKTAGVLVEGILPRTYCSVTTNHAGCIGKTPEFYVYDVSRDFNVTLECTNIVVDGGNESTGLKDLGFFVHRDGQTIGLDSIILEITGGVNIPLTTKSDGFVYLTGVPSTAIYQIKIDNPLYKPYLGVYTNVYPMDIALIPIQNINFIDVRIKNNGSVQANASIIVKEGDKTVFTGLSGTSLYSYGIYGFECDIGKLYSVEASYGGKTGILKNIECPLGEGVTYTLDITGGVLSTADETADSIIDFTAWMWYFTEIILALFVLLILKRLGNEIFT